MTYVNPLVERLADVFERGAYECADYLAHSGERARYISCERAAAYADDIRAIVLAEERAKPAAQRWAEMGDEEVAAMAKEMPAVASAWELIDEGDGLHVRRAYCVESSLLFASSRDEMRDVDSSNCGYRLIGGIPDAAPNAEVR